MVLPFWQQSLSSLEYDDLAAFVDERTPEGEHLEYKQPTYNQAGKVDLTDQLLETLVAFANGGGGMLILGIAESADKDNRPALMDAIVGVDLSKHRRGYRLEQALLSVCADRIEPLMAPEVQSIRIPEEEGAPRGGRVVLLVRVRTGPLPPYNLRNRGIYVRVGDADRLASVREIEALFQRRIDPAALGATEKTGWERARSAVFVPAGAAAREQPPFFMCVLTPAFPIEPIVIDDRSDEFFRRVCINGFKISVDSAILHLDNGVAFNPYRLPNTTGYPPYVCAYADGSIGIQWTFGVGAARPASGPVRLDVVETWRLIRRMIVAAAEWPRTLCGYSGSLTCRIGLNNIHNTIMVVPDDDWLEPAARVPPILNDSPLWLRQIEWDRDESINDVLAEQMSFLARMLQFPHFHSLLHMIRPAAEQEPGGYR